MSKSVVLGNGKVLVGLDKHAQVRDLYFPHVGQENHVSGNFLHRLGVYADGRMSWFSEPAWDIQIDCLTDTFTSSILAVNKELSVEIRFSDTVLHENDIFLRKINIKNTGNRKREIKMFFHHEFEIRETARGDTAFFDPIYKSIIHYRGRRVFLISLSDESGRTFDDYTTGIFGVEGKEGSFRDAEDGKLSKNPIEHGHADSVIAKTFDLESGEEKEIWYWIVLGETLDNTRKKHDEFIKNGPKNYHESSGNFWKSWIKAHKISFDDLPSEVETLYYKSLLIMKAHVDHGGGILASSDSDMLNYGRDTYNYVWPRDAARIALALLEAGDPEPARKFFHFIRDVTEDDGYVLHKYRPDRSLGSSWHPWIQDGNPALPIQEDETALVLITLDKYFEKTGDFDLIDNLYNSLIRKMASFLLAYRDEEARLPLPSYDLWEERYGVHAFTTATVVAGLSGAANIAEALGKKRDHRSFKRGADEIKQAARIRFQNTDNQYLHRSFRKDLPAPASTGRRAEGNKIFYDSTIDISSIFGFIEYGIYGAGDREMLEAYEALEKNLLCQTSVGGYPRYIGDKYRLIHNDVPGNPWIITTLWAAQIIIKRASSTDELKEAKDWILWATHHAGSSGVMPEQIDPHTGEHLSASPLTWSHAEFVITVLAYLDKKRGFEGK